MKGVLLPPLALLFLASCAHNPPPPLSSAEVERALTETCRQSRPDQSEDELRHCVLDAASTYARGLETFEQSYPLAPIRVQCKADPSGARSFNIDCK